MLQLRLTKQSVRLLKAYQDIVKQGGKITLTTLMIKHWQLYLGLLLMFIAGFVILFNDPNKAAEGMAISGVALGAFVRDVVILASVQRSLGLTAKVLNIEKINQLLHSEKNES